MWWLLLRDRIWALLISVGLGIVPAHALDATWSPPLGSSDWNAAANWIQNAVPTGVATFGATNSTTITFSDNASVGTLQFNNGAPPYSFDLSSSALTITGNGIANRSTNSPIFATSSGNVVGIDRLNFHGVSSAGNATITNNSGGITSFLNSSSAENSTITNNHGFTIFSKASTAGSASITNNGGFTRFTDASTAGHAAIFDDPNETSSFEGTSTAGNATITNNGGGIAFSDASTAGNATIINNSGGVTNFLNSSRIGNANIINNSGGVTAFLTPSTAANFTITTNSGGETVFLNTSTAGSAILTTNSGGIALFFDTSTAGNATITTRSGAVTQLFGTSTGGNAIFTTNSGGVTQFFDTSTGGQARFINEAGGIFDISGLSSDGMTAGSIEGAGLYQVGSKSFTVGLNNLNTEVSGMITDGGNNGGTGGALVKVGTGTLTLTGPNTYSGGTSFNGGILAVFRDSNLGTGPLSFDGGTLEALAPGGGIISSKAITLNARGGTFLANAGTTSVFRGALSGPGTFTKDGLGTLILTGKSAYSGDTNINGGTLTIQNGGAVSDREGRVGANPGSAGTVKVSGVGSIWTNGGALFVGGNSGGPAGAGVLQISEGGTVNSAAATLWATGTLAIGGSATLNSPLTINGGTVRTLATTTFSNNATLGAGGAIFDSNGFDSTFSGAFTGSGGIAKINAGRVTLNGVNTYSGVTHMIGGVLAVDHDGNLGTGALNFQGGTLEALPAGDGITSSKAITIDGAGGTFLADPGTASTLGGAINGSGSLTKDGLGRLILTGPNTYRGGTVLNAGILTVHSAHALGVGDVLVNGGTLNADPQQIQVGGNYTQKAKGTLQLQVAGASPGQYDSLHVDGTPHLEVPYNSFPLGFSPRPATC